MNNPINWFPGHMASAIKRIVDRVKLCDLIIEIIDARIPISSQNPVIKNIGVSKPKLYILKKADLSDMRITKMWIEHFKANNINFLEVSNKNHNVKQVLVNKINEILEETLAKKRSKGLVNPKITVYVLGIPNVGKSTFINMVREKTVAKAGNKPGLTKGEQVIKINKSVDLIDTPGLLWPKIDEFNKALKLSYIYSIKSDVLNKETICQNFLKFMFTNYIDKFLAMYSGLKKTDLDMSSLDDEVIFFNNLDVLEKIRFSKKLNDNYEAIINDILQKLWNNKFLNISYEKPADYE